LLNAPTAGFTMPAGTVALSPGLGIASSVARLGTGALITLPATPVAGRVLMIGIGNPATGEVTVLPTVAADDHSITGMLTALDGSAAATLRMGGSSRLDDPGIVAFLMGIEHSRLLPDFDTGFRPGTDDWDFASLALASCRFLPSQASWATNPFRSSTMASSQLRSGTTPTSASPAHRHSTARRNSLRESRSVRAMAFAGPHWPKWTCRPS